MKRLSTFKIFLLLNIIFLAGCSDLIQDFKSISQPETLTSEQKEIRELKKQLKISEQKNKFWEIYSSVLAEYETDPQKKDSSSN